MRAREFLFEDSRNTIQKLEELIAHPATEDTVKDVARSRLELLRSQVPVEPQRRISIHTNIDEADLHRPFVVGMSLGDLYDNLCSLSPSPSTIQFGRQGAIQMLVPPPFMGKTRAQYVAEIQQACPGARHIGGHMIEEQGYFFTISYI